MDFNGTPGQPQIRQIKLNIFSIVAITFGVLSILTVSTVLFSIFFGSLAVIFAVLSKGRNRKFDKLSIRAFWFGIASIIVSFFIMGTAIFMYENNQEYHDSFNELYEDMYGTTFDDYVDEMFDLE